MTIIITSTHELFPKPAFPHKNKGGWKRERREKERRMMKLLVLKVFKFYVLVLPGIWNQTLESDLTSPFISLEQKQRDHSNS
jgi:hypothetical protein